MLFSVITDPNDIDSEHQPVMETLAPMPDATNTQNPLFTRD